MKKDFIVNIGNGYVIESCVHNEKVNVNKRLYKDVIKKNFHIDIHRKQVYVFIEQEKLYVKFLSIPNLKRQDMYSTIKQELNYTFGDTKNFIFCYDVLKENNTSTDIIIYYSDSQKIKVINKYYKQKNKLNINMIQFQFINNFIKLRKTKNYIVFVYYNRDLYIIGVIDSRMYANNYVRDFNVGCAELAKQMEFFINTYFDYFDKIKKIYMCNFEEEYKWSYRGIDAENIGNLSGKEFIKNE